MARLPAGAGAETRSPEVTTVPGPAFHIYTWSLS